MLWHFDPEHLSFAFVPVGGIRWWRSRVETTAPERVQTLEPVWTENLNSVVLRLSPPRMARELMTPVR
jgi:hypothetical protein